jgi:hypothetical protein
MAAASCSNSAEYKKPNKLTRYAGMTTTHLKSVSPSSAAALKPFGEPNCSQPPSGEPRISLVLNRRSKRTQDKESIVHSRINMKTGHPPFGGSPIGTHTLHWKQSSVQASSFCGERLKNPGCGHSPAPPSHRPGASLLPYVNDDGSRRARRQRCSGGSAYRTPPK